MYYLIMLFVLGGTIYETLNHHFTTYQMMIVILLSLVTELLVQINSGVNRLNVEVDEFNEEEKK